MPSALKLFHNRRTSFGLRNSTVDDLGLDSSPADGNSHHRTATATATAAGANRRHPHSHIHSNRRDHRQDHDGCNPPPRRTHRHRLSEHGPVHPDQGVGPFPSGSIINSEDFRSIRRWGATANDRLPGVVLLARERLLERLRGVHISENRRNNTPSSSNILAEERWQEAATRNHPPGLDREALNGLSVEVFDNGEEEDERSSECSICLEGFRDGDEVISLGCMHRFHWCCLLPWVEVCGACPNCRKPIVVTQ